jgi:hypothetical protein
MMSGGSSNDYLMDKLHAHLKELQCFAAVYVNLAYIYMMSNMGSSDAQIHMKQEENCGGRRGIRTHFSPKYYFNLPLSV